MALDFIKLCNKQSLCVKCGLYFPNDMIIYWSGCNHVYCMDCIRSEISMQNKTQKRIPMCICNECQSTLSLERLNNIPGLNTFGYCIDGRHYLRKRKLWQWSGCNHEFCADCAASCILRDLSDGQIPLCDGCGSELTMWTILPRRLRDQPDVLDTLRTLIDRKDKFKCCLCEEWHENQHKIIWSKRCGHQYGKECMQKIILTDIPRKKPLIGILKSCKIPRCVAGSCSIGLSLLKAHECEANEFQLRRLNELIGGKSGDKETCILM